MVFRLLTVFCGLAGLSGAGAVAARQPGRQLGSVHAPLTRRTAAHTAAAALFGGGLLPKPKDANAGDDGPQAELAGLVTARAQLLELAAQLRSGQLTGSEDDSIVVLRTVALQQAGTGALMESVLGSSPRLGAEQRTSASAAAALYSKSVSSLKEGCRRRERGAQEAAASAADAAIGDYLRAISTIYSVPVSTAARLYSSDPIAFTQQYFGVFSCEGMGLKRLPDSNNCGDPLEN